MNAPHPGRTALEARLAALGIAIRTVEHPPVHTVDEARPYWDAIEGEHTKNLFLKDAKGGLWLIVLPADKRADLKALAALTGAKKFSFASAELLQEVLGVQQGSVSAFALLNDAQRRVRFVLDAALTRAPVIAWHPLTNTATSAIAYPDFLRFLEATGHRLESVELEG
jgi:Ala-tRNA(Pro) deacylase